VLGRWTLDLENNRTTLPNLNPTPLRKNTMLTITRVPTVMLLEQMSQSTDDLKAVEAYGASKLMNSESLPGAIMPLYKCAQRSPLALRKRVRSFGDLQSVPDILDYNSTDSADSSSDEDSMNSKSLFDMILLAQVRFLPMSYCRTPFRRTDLCGLYDDAISENLQCLFVFFFDMP